MATKKLISERFAYEGGAVDRTAGPNPIVRGVLLCGPISANRRRYGKEAFAGDRVKRYADKPVYLNHGNGRDDRRYEDQLGWVRNPRHRADGMPVGDIEVKKSHPFAETFLNDAEHNPRAVGMSHVAHCTTRPATDGWEDVTEMIEAESVDVVTSPATTKGLFNHENRDRGSTVPQTTLRAVIESVRAKLKTPLAQAGARKLLLVAEDDASMAPLMDAPIDAPEDGTEPEDQLWVGFMGAIESICAKYKGGEADATAAGKEVVKYLKAHEKLMKGGKDDEPGKGGTAPPEPEEESKRRKAGALQECLDACDRAGFAPTPEQRTILTELSPATRLLMIEQYKKAAEAAPAGPTSAGRSRMDPTATGGGGGTSKTVAEAAPPTDGAGFAKYIQG